jgi:phage repressor protein C with HTH and peptisase S24 domain
MEKKSSELLREARESKGYTQAQVADYLGIGLRNYQHLESGRFPKYKTEVIKEVEKLLGIKIYDKLYNNATKVSHETEKKEAAPSYLITRRQKKMLSEPFLVPLVPVKAQAGYASSYDNSDFLNNLELYPILPGINPRGAVWRYFEIQGDSMEPGLYGSDLVLVSMVPPEDWQDVKKEQVYVIVTSSDVFIKIVYPLDRNTWLLKSSNKKHKDRKIEVKDIKELWYFRRLVSNKIRLDFKK